jgi:drug/metabolite transporter (DMT)-like permease
VTDPPPSPGPGSPNALGALGARHPLGVVWFGVVLFSTGPVLVADASISGVAFSFWRLWAGVAVMAVAALVYRRATGARTTSQGAAWAVACGVAFAAHQLMFMTALRATSVVDVTLMNTLAPIAVGIMAVRAFGERPGRRFRLWSLVAMAGAATIALVGSTGPEGDPAGMALAAGNVVFYSLFFVGSKLARPHIDTVPFLFGNMSAAAVAVSAFVVLSGEAVQPVSDADLARCAAVAVLPGAIGHFSVTWALRWVPANLPPVIMLSIPVLSGAMAWAVVGEAVSGVQALAGLGTLVGVFGAVRSPSAPRLRADEALLAAEES